MKKLTALVALGVGYVFGARAGRARYEQIKAQADKAWHHPKVQEQVDKAGELAKSAAGTAGTAAFEKARDAATTAAAAAKEKASAVAHRGSQDQASSSGRSTGTGLSGAEDKVATELTPPVTASDGVPPAGGS